ncbi:hypothetical protein GPALN_014656 [Globodera pallida]|nr:hypothetical protein GPALN_014656 [Globodera pallida]
MENTRDQLDTYQPKLAHYLQALTDDDRATFIGHLQKLDFSSLNSAFKRAVEPKLPCAGDIQPIPAQQKVDRAKLGEGETERLTKIGLKAVAEGRVAAVVLAGGQASRLGSAHPKGVLRLGTGLGQNSSSPDSLLFIQATQIARLQRMARERFPAEANECGGHITWLVMTSGTTDTEIRDHLDAVLTETGLSPAQLLVFTQNEIPAFDFGGQAFLKSPTQLVTAPDGNGGFYDAICPLLPELEKRGVQHLHIYCVDNILCRVADPLMIGCAIDRGADCALKVIEKRDPAERRCPVDPSKLFLNAGSIANHVVTLNFLREACAKADAVLPYHVARKRIPFWDPKLKKTVQPTEPNGIKLERFIFDAFTLSKNVLLWQVPAEEEFSPLKNPESAGVDCLSTCLRALQEPHAQWIREACIDAQKKEETRNGLITCHGRRNFPSIGLSRRTLVGIGIAGMVDGVISQTEQEQKTWDLQHIVNAAMAASSSSTSTIMWSTFLIAAILLVGMCLFLFFQYKASNAARIQNHESMETFQKTLRDGAQIINRRLDTYQPKLAHYLQALTDDDRATFIGHLQKLDFSSLNSAFKRAVEPKLPCAGDIQPIPAQQKVDRAKLGEGETERLTKIGLKAVAEGRVAAVVLAGGQASRLGSAHPKGVLRLGTGLGQNSSSPDSLLFIQATQIARLQRMARERFPAEANECGGHITWLVMTSGTTDSEIRDHLDAVLKETGLSPAQLLVFTQNEIPAFDFGGQAFLKSPSQLVTAPDGNGGFYDAICPLLPELVKRGVQHLHIYCVDNILCRVADPLMIGCAIDRGADCALKVIEKRDPAELVGHVCRVQELVRVLEYSEITRELAERRCPSDPSKLFLNAGSIANHVVSLPFLREACAKADAVLPYHMARKRIPFWDPNLKKTVQPTEPNGIKLERFIFDAFTLSKNVLLWQVPAEEEFSPLKNPESAGVDCLSTCLRALQEPHAQWIREACIDAQKKELTDRPTQNFSMADFWTEVIVADLIAELEKDKQHAQLDWLSANSPLVKRFQEDIARLSEETTNSSSNLRSDVYKYNRSEELDRLFEKDRDSKAMRELNVRHFLINRVLDEFRPNIRRLSALTIERTIATFCVNQRKEVEQHTLDVYDFLMDCVEHRPPLTAEQRWFWMCVVTSMHADHNDDGQVRDNVRIFVDKCCTFFKNDIRSHEYKLFLLTLLEYDYAATVARQRHRIEPSGSGGDAKSEAPRARAAAVLLSTTSSSTTSSSSSSAAGALKRNVPLNSMADLDTFPLVYLMLCRVHNDSANFSEQANNKLYALILDVLLSFNPRNLKQHIRVSRLYARLVGLLLDVLLFVELGADPYHQITKPGQITDKLRVLLRKVRKQNDDMEWSIFVDLAGVPWLKEFAPVIESPKKHKQMKRSES